MSDISYDEEINKYAEWLKYLKNPDSVEPTYLREKTAKLTTPLQLLNMLPQVQKEPRFKSKLKSYPDFKNKDVFDIEYEIPESEKVETRQLENEETTTINFLEDDANGYD